jgi:hypothetical protein
MVLALRGRGVVVLVCGRVLLGKLKRERGEKETESRRKKGRLEPEGGVGTEGEREEARKESGNEPEGKKKAQR